MVLDLFQVFWSNKVKKFGVPGLGKPKASNFEFLMSNAMKSGLYEFGMKEKNQIKTLNLIFK